MLTAHLPRYLRRHTSFLAGQYDSLRKDYNLFRTLLITVIVIALVLVVLLIVSLTGKKDRGRRERISERKDETGSRPQKEEAPLHSRKEEREKLIPDPFEEEEAEEMEYIVEEDQGDIIGRRTGFQGGGRLL